MAITAILFMGGLGFTLAVLLAAASRIFHVDEDPRLAAVKSVLPGLNCGACGYTGCESGCLGGGTCASVCPFDAIRLDEDRLPRIDPDRCRGCGRCADACPRGVIRLETLSDRLLGLDRTSDCLAPCRQKCPAQINVPVFVGHLQRYMGEWEQRSGRRIPIDCLPDTSRRVAVVGSGPAGLSCAYFLRRLGHRPTVFEARSGLGGMLRYGIPAYRLPRDIVDWEIEGILELGMEVRTQVALGRDFTLTALRHEGFEAIFLGMGAWTIPPLCVPGETAEGVWQSLDFLAALGADDLRDLKNKQVVVIGESNTAMDCARCSIRLGAGAVSVISPRDRQEVSARKRDVTRAEAEGVSIRFMMRPVWILEDVSGRLMSHWFTRCKRNGQDVLDRHNLLKRFIFSYRLFSLPILSVLIYVDHGMSVAQVKNENIQGNIKWRRWVARNRYLDRERRVS